MSEKAGTPEELAERIGVVFKRLLDSSEIQSLHKPLPGYQAMVDDTSRLIDKYGTVLALEPEVSTNLNEALADLKRLEPLENVLEKVYQSVYHQRMQATSRCMEGLYEVSRRIREFGNAYPEIKEEGQFLLDFIKAFRIGPKKGKDTSEKQQKSDEENKK